MPHTPNLVAKMPRAGADWPSGIRPRSWADPTTRQFELDPSCTWQRAAGSDSSHVTKMSYALRIAPRDRHLNLRVRRDQASYNTMRSVAVVLALLAGADAFVPAARSSQQWVSARSTSAATSTVRAASADGSDEGRADLGAAASQAMATAVLAAALASPIVAPPAAFAGDMAAQMEVVQDYDVAGGVGVDGASSLWMAAGPSPAPFAERKKAASAPAPAPAPVPEVRTQSR